MAEAATAAMRALAEKISFARETTMTSEDVSAMCAFGCACEDAGARANVVGAAGRVAVGLINGMGYEKKRAELETIGEMFILWFY